MKRIEQMIEHPLTSPQPSEIFMASLNLDENPPLLNHLPKREMAFMWLSKTWSSQVQSVADC
jgi:hypothetical protein